MEAVADKPKRPWGGANRKSIEEHLADGTYRKDRHGPLGPDVLDIPRKPPGKTRAGPRSQSGWCQSAADEIAVRHGYRFNERLAAHAADFFASHLTHSKGEWYGKPFNLLPWQRDRLVYPLFGWVNPTTGLRRFRRAFVEVPKKNGKSTLASGIGLYMLTADGEPGAEVYSAAVDQAQASIVHSEAISMVDSSVKLSACLKVNRSTRNILYPATRSWYRSLSSGPGSKEGLNIHACIIDELHAWRGRNLWDVLRYGYRARREPLQFVISTAGDDDQSICFAEYERAKAVLAGRVEDDSLFALIYEAKPEDDWEAEATWQAANPSLGATFTVESLAQDAAAAKGKATETAVFQRYSLNIWQKSTNPWLAPGAWDKCHREFWLPEMEGRECYAALDLSKTRDMTCLALIFPWESEAGRAWRLHTHFWIPEDGARRLDTLTNIKQWIADGWVTAMPGEVCDYSLVESAVADFSRRFDLRMLTYDQMYAAELTQRLEQNHGIPRVATPQTITALAGPTAEFERAVLEQALHHDGSPVMEWQAGHVQVWSDTNSNKRPVKPKPGDYRKIDGIIASVMALGLASRQCVSSTSIYEQEEMLVL